MVDDNKAQHAPRLLGSFSGAERAEIARRAAAGEKVGALAVEFRTHTGTISRIVKGERAKVADIAPTSPQHQPDVAPSPAAAALARLPEFRARLAGANRETIAQALNRIGMGRMPPEAKSAYMAAIEDALAALDAEARPATPCATATGTEAPEVAKFRAALAKNGKHRDGEWRIDSWSLGEALGVDPAKFNQTCRGWFAGDTTCRVELQPTATKPREVIFLNGSQVRQVVMRSTSAVSAILRPLYAEVVGMWERGELVPVNYEAAVKAEDLREAGASVVGDVATKDDIAGLANLIKTTMKEVALTSALQQIALQKQEANNRKFIALVQQRVFTAYYNEYKADMGDGVIYCVIYDAIRADMFKNGQAHPDFIEERYAIAKLDKESNTWIRIPFRCNLDHNDGNEKRSDETNCNPCAPQAHFMKTRGLYIELFDAMHKRLCERLTKMGPANRKFVFMNPGA